MSKEKIPKVRRSLAEVVPTARKILDKFARVSLRADIAGSVRRNTPDVGDIEIVCLPRFQLKTVQEGLFPQEKEVNLVEEMLSQGQYQAVYKNGSRMKQFVLNNGLYLDVFIVANAEDYGRQFAIRTGCQEYSMQIASKWKSLGWCGTPDGLRLRKQCKEISKNTFRCDVKQPTLPPKFKTEQIFFEFLGIPYMPPEFRNQKLKIK